MMMRILVFLAVLLPIFDANAQMLLDSAKNTANLPEKSFDVPEIKVGQQKLKKEQGVTLEDLTRNDYSNNDIAKALSGSISASSENDENIASDEVTEEDVFIPEGELYRLDTPTVDGSKRGGQAFVEVDDQGRMKKAEKIFLFYDKFKVTNFMSNTATCDVRFNILSNLDRKISQIDVKLVWPDITTTLSFSNVAPNTQTYYNYSLIGNGCYGMDIAPNIIVNRCRVKGMTASECASKLIWLSK